MESDKDGLKIGFENGKRVALTIRNECSNTVYTTSFLHSLFEEEGRGLFEVRQAVLGHLQQGGDPSPFDRIHATRLATRCIEFLSQQLAQKRSDGAFIGLQNGKVQYHNLADFPAMVDFEQERPRDQWWLTLRPIAQVLAQPGPSQVIS